MSWEVTTRRKMIPKIWRADRNEEIMAVVVSHGVKDNDE